MNLTYTITDTGYIIYNNGIIWIVQEGYIPPEFINEIDKSFAKSAELNIAKIIADDEANKNVANSLEETQEDLNSAMMAITELYEMILG